MIHFAREGAIARRSRLPCRNPCCDAPVLIVEVVLGYREKFDDPNLPGQMQTTITLTKVSCGTELHIVQEGIPAVIPAEACCLGWQESLLLLAKLVEANIRD
jgi:hypothetical protein